MKKYLITTLILLFSTLFRPDFSSAQWSDGGTLISNNSSQNHRPMIAATDDGGMYVTWMATNGSTGLSTVYLAAIKSDGTAYSGWNQNGMEIYNVNNNFAPVVITSEDQGAIVAWYGYPDGSSNAYIYVQKYSREGVALWNSGNSPVRVSVNLSRNDKYPNIISDLNGGAYIAWTSYIAVETNSPDVYLQHIDNSGKVASGWNANPTGVAVTENLRESMPRIVLTPDNSAVYVMYNEGLTEIALKLKKVNTEDGTLASSWPAGGEPLSLGPNVMPDPVKEQFLFCDKDNNAVAFWLDSRMPNMNYEVYMQTVSPSGALMLPYGGIYIGGKGLMVEGTYTGTKYFNASHDELDDTYLLVFANYSNELGDDIDAVKVKADGTIKWSKSPLTTTHKCDYQKALPDGKGGMNIFYKGGGPYILYVLPVDSNGNIYKDIPEPGIAFGDIDNYDALNPNYDFSIKANCLGRAVVIWDRYRDNGSQYNIYACNLLPDHSVCSADDFNCTVSIADTKNYISAEVFPDPFSIELNILVSGFKSQQLRFRMYDIAGNLLIDKQINNIDVQISVSTAELSNGLYFYTLQDRNSIIKKGKLIKL